MNRNIYNELQFIILTLYCKRLKVPLRILIILSKLDILFLFFSISNEFDHLSSSLLLFDSSKRIKRELWYDKFS